ncbi:NADPH-dependent FMN reductase [Streptomyces sp. NPDC059558]|uniref:NADPH-dependent FMN reductase n=1 Tax=unclassified Streptomyces TaxID=2593676 RepID=UPI00368C7DD8
MHALLISGSPRAGSGTSALAALAGDALLARGATVTLLELAEPSGPRLRDVPRSYDAVVLASPVHHGSYSGLLKLALDGVPGDWLADTAVGLLAHGSGPRTGSVVCEHLRTVARALGGWVAPTQIAACPADFAPGPHGAPAPDASLLRRCETLAAELHRCARMLRTPAPLPVTAAAPGVV